jgi:hypothetical protein
MKGFFSLVAETHDHENKARAETTLKTYASILRSYEKALLSAAEIYSDAAPPFQITESSMRFYL